MSGKAAWVSISLAFPQRGRRRTDVSNPQMEFEPTPIHPPKPAAIRNQFALRE
jgi:hypothetical protein